MLLYVYYCNVPWAAHFDCKTGQYLIQRYVLRVAPSLRVARTAADTLRYMKGLEEKGHALVVGNPAAHSLWSAFAQGRSRSRIRVRAA